MEEYYFLGVNQAVLTKDKCMHGPITVLCGSRAAVVSSNPSVILLLNSTDQVSGPLWWPWGDRRGVSSWVWVDYTHGLFRRGLFLIVSGHFVQHWFRLYIATSYAQKQPAKKRQFHFWTYSIVDKVMLNRLPVLHPAPLARRRDGEPAMHAQCSSDTKTR